MTLALSHPAPLAAADFAALPTVERSLERSPARPCILSLDRDRAARLSLRPGVRLECLLGRAWITLDGDLRDVLLEPGEAFVVDRRAPVTVFAFDAPTTLHVHPPAEAPRRPLSGWRAGAACVAVVAGSLLALLGARFAVADLTERAAAVSLPATADGEGRAADAGTLR